MVSFKKPDLDSFQERIHIATLFVTVCFLLLVTRLVWLQLVSHGKYALLAESNRIALVPAPANRGLLIDRNGIVIGRNYSALTLDVNAEEVKGNVDQLISDLSEIIDISPRDRRNFKRSLEDSRNMGTFPLRSMLNETETARFMANRYRFPGVEIRARSFREYPYNELASHLSARGWRVICPDTVGRGLSQWSADPQNEYCLKFYARLARELLDGLGLRAVHWVGTSMGGAIGTLCAAGLAEPTLKHRILSLTLNDNAPQLAQVAIERIKTYAGNPPSFATVTELEAFLRQVYQPFGWLSDAQWRRLTETSVRRLPDGRITPHYDPAMAMQSLWDRRSGLYALADVTVNVETVDSQRLIDSVVALAHDGTLGIG